MLTTRHEVAPVRHRKNRKDRAVYHHQTLVVLLQCGDASADRAGRKLFLRRLNKRLQRGAGWSEERRAGMRRREIKQAVVSSRRITDIHSLQHLLDHPKIPGIADKIGSEFLSSRSAEGHVVAQDVMFGSIGIYNSGQRLVRFARSVVVIDFDIVYLRATDDLFLERRWNPRPRVEIVQVLLNDDIAASGEISIFIADERRCGQIEAGRVGRAIDKAKKVTRIEKSKARNFVDDSHAGAKTIEQNPFKLKAQIGTFGSDVEEKVARG